MLGDWTGLGILEQALANIPVLVSTWGRGPLTDIDFKLYKITGRPPRDDAEYLPQQLCQPCEPDERSEPESEEEVYSRDECLDPHEEGDLNCYTEYN